MQELSTVTPQAFSLSELQKFHGTNIWYHHWLRTIVYTDGVKYLAEHAGCYWLIDNVAIFLPSVRKKHPDHFYSIHFTAKSKNNSGLLTFEDGNYHVLRKIKIPYTDFSIKDQMLLLFLVQCERGYCLMVPSEY